MTAPVAQHTVVFLVPLPRSPARRIVSMTRAKLTSLDIMKTFIAVTIGALIAGGAGWWIGSHSAHSHASSDGRTHPAERKILYYQSTMHPWVKSDKPGKCTVCGMTRQMLVSELSEKMRLVPGAVPGFLQPIENRVLMISTGIRAQLGVKILGDNLDVLQKIAFDVERIVKEVRGATGVAPSRVQGKPFLEIEVNREAM